MTSRAREFWFMAGLFLVASMMLIVALGTASVFSREKAPPILVIDPGPVGAADAGAVQ